MGDKWSKAEDALLVRLWTKDGLSASEISRQLLGRSRNACVGRVHRLLGADVSRRAAVLPGAAAPRPAAAVAVQTKAPPPVPRPKAPPPAPAEAIVPTAVVIFPEGHRAVTLADLGAGCCKWPVGAQSGAQQLFCASPAVLEGARYCPEHTTVSGSAVKAKDWDRKHAKSLQRALAS